MEKTELFVRQVVADAIREQIKNPARAIVNAESGFVAQRLREYGYTGIATRYWNWVCIRLANREEFGDEIYELQKQLDNLDSKIDMPAWGTYGT